MAQTQKQKLPQFAFIADGFTDEDVADRVVAAAEAGAPWIHLRGHDAGEQAFSEAARALAKRLREGAPGVKLSVNGRLDVAERLSAGLHTGRRGPAVDKGRQRLGPEAQIGFSAHSVEEAQLAAGADYLFFSPVFSTKSKPDHPGAGLGALCRFCQSFPETPVFALGGVTPERIAPCLNAGAHGVAVLSGILHAPDSAASTTRYLQAHPDE